MSDSTPPVDELLLKFQLTHKWNCFGKEVVYDVFPVGVSEQITARTSGLDAHAKDLAMRILDLAHAIRTVGGYDFKGSLEDKLKFVRAMSDPMFDLFYEEFRAARVKQLEMLKEAQDELKKSSPEPT